jgi:hypothetical protein
MANVSTIRQVIMLPRSARREGIIARVASVLSAMPMDITIRVEITEQKARRSNPQNDYMWALYDFILRKGGEAMAGWTKDDLHAHFLEEHFGTEVRELFGKKRRLRRHSSSKLNKQEFADYLEFILRYMAERGVYLPGPDDNWEEALAA